MYNRLTFCIELAKLGIGQRASAEEATMEEQKLHVPARSVFAAILLNAMDSPRRDRGDWPTIVDLSNKILELKKNFHLDVSNIPIRADRNGWISDDFSSFVNRFVLFGLAERSPIRLGDEARKLCMNILMEDSGKYTEQVEALVRAVGLDWHPAKENSPSLV
jgi:hypothetical protein